MNYVNSILLIIGFFVIFLFLEAMGSLIMDHWHEKWRQEEAIEELINSLNEEKTEKTNGFETPIESFEEIIMN